jgi:transposase InsO family protein
MRIREIAQTRVRYGYRMIRVLLNREGWKVGKDLVYRLYKEEGLGLRKRPVERRRAVVHRQERFKLARASRPTTRSVSRSMMMHLWAYRHGVTIDLKEAQKLIETWRPEYNVSRPHRALDDKTPAEFASHITLKHDMTETKQAEN